MGHMNDLSDIEIAPLPCIVRDVVMTLIKADFGSLDGIPARLLADGIGLKIHCAQEGASPDLYPLLSLARLRGLVRYMYLGNY